MTADRKEKARAGRALGGNPKAGQGTGFRFRMESYYARLATVQCADAVTASLLAGLWGNPRHGALLKLAETTRPALGSFGSPSAFYQVP